MPDGYLIGNPMLVGDIANIDTSLLGNLLQSGVARLYSRDSEVNLAEGVVNSAERVRTFAAIVRNKTWRNLRDDLEYLSRNQIVRQNALVWPGDRNMGEVFYRLMDQLAGTPARRDQMMSPDLARDFDWILSHFQEWASADSFKGARTTWENLCWLRFHGQIVRPEVITELRTTEKRTKAFPAYPQVRSIMQVANEVYHLAHASGAAYSIGSVSADGATIGVSTALTTAFDSLLPVEEVPQLLVGERREALGRLAIVVPPELEFGKDFSFIRHIESDGETRRAKRDYLSSVEKFVNGQEVEAKAEEARRNYIAFLARIMLPSVKSGPAGKNINMLVGGIGFRVVEALILYSVGVAALLPKLLFNLSIDDFKSRTVERFISCSIEEGLKAVPVVSRPDGSLPRDLGFYAGPLSHQGAADLLASVGPAPK